MSKKLLFIIFSLFTFQLFAQELKTTKGYIFLDGDGKDGKYFYFTEIESGVLRISDKIEFLDEDGARYPISIQKMTKKGLDEYYNNIEIPITEAKKGDKISVDFTCSKQMKRGNGSISTAGSNVTVEKEKIKQNAYGKLNNLDLLDGHDSNQNVTVPPNMPLFDNPNFEAFQINLLYSLKGEDLGGQLLMRGKFTGKTGDVEKIEAIFSGKTVGGKKENNFYNGTKPNPSNFKLSFTKCEKKGTYWLVSGTFSGTLKSYLPKLMPEFDNTVLNFSEGRFEDIQLRICDEKDKAQLGQMIAPMKKM